MVPVLAGSRRSVAARGHRRWAASKSFQVAPFPEALAPLGFKFLDEDALRKRFDFYSVPSPSPKAPAAETCLIGTAQMEAMLRDAGHAEAGLRTKAEKVLDSLFVDAPASQRASQLTLEQPRELRWETFRESVALAADPVDGRIRPITSCLVVHFLGLGVQMPVMPIYARSLGIEAADIGIITGSSALVRILCNVPMAALAESAGRRPLLVFGPAAGSLAYFGLSVSTTMPELVFFNAAAGVGGAALSCGANLYLNDIATPRNRARTMAPLMITALLGMAIGPAMGGLLLDKVGVAVPFTVCSGLMGLAAGGCWALLPETKRGTEVHASERRESALAMWLRLMQLPALQGVNSTVVMTGFTQGAAPVTTILYATESLGLSGSSIGLMFTGQIIVLAAMTHPATVLSDRLTDRKRAMVPAITFRALCMGCLPFCPTPEMFVGLFVVSAAGDAVSMVNVSPYIMDNTGPEERAQALSMRSMSQDGGMLAGAATMGALVQMTSSGLGIQVTAFMLGLSAIFFALRNNSKA